MPQTITIKLPVTTHRRGPEYLPATFDERLGSVRGGAGDPEVIPPGTAFEIEEAEGRDLVERFGGQVVRE